MSSSNKKARGSERESIRLSSRPDGLRLRDTNVLFKRSEIEWLVKRAGNMENILVECRKSPERLLDEAQGILEGLGASHGAADRQIESLFHYQLAIYVSELKQKFLSGEIRGHKEPEAMSRKLDQIKDEKPPDRVLLKRLKAAYWPTFVEEWLKDPQDVRSSKVQKRYVSWSFKHRSLAWNRGRVRFFYDKLICGEEIDPIEIDSRVHQYRVGSPISWGGPFIEDGHHRFAAAILARKRYIKAYLGGLVTTHRWLRGEVPYKSFPEEMTL